MDCSPADRAPTTLRALLALNRTAAPTPFVEHELSNTALRFEIEYRDTVDGAIASLADGAFDVALLDLSLPDANGASSVTGAA